MQGLVALVVLFSSMSSFGRLEVPIKEKESTQSVEAEVERARLWTLRTFLDSPDYRFLLATGDGRGDLQARNQRLQFNPSNNPEIGFVISRGLFRVGYRTNIPFVENPIYRDYDLGSTHVTDLNFGWDGEYFSVGTFYSRFRGYFVDLNATTGFTVESDDGSTSVTTGTSSDGIPDIWTRPDVRTYNYGLYGNSRFPLLGRNSFFGDFSKEFSFWDLALTGGVGYQRMAIEGDSPFVPVTRASIFPELAQLTGIYQHIFYFKIGMANQFNFGRWFLQANLEGGSEALTHYERNAATKDRQRFSNGTRIDFTFGFGYGGKYNRLRFRYRSLYRIMETTLANSLDSGMSHTGIEYTYLF